MVDKIDWPLNTAYHGDCLDFMKTLPDKSIDMILCDLPYGTTACKWDIIIPFRELWQNYNRIIKDSGAIVLTGAEPFSSMLRTSNLKMYKYDWKWKKQYGTGFLNAWKQPLRDTEDICVFYKQQPKYNPIIIDKPKENIRPITDRSSLSECYGEFNLSGRKLPPDKSMPKTTLEFNTEQNNIHPTQKPVKLFEYLIRTYTDKDDIILDGCLGAFTTGVAAYNTGRSWIGCEMDDKHFKTGLNRYFDETQQNLLEFD